MPQPLNVAGDTNHVPSESMFATKVWFPATIQTGALWTFGANENDVYRPTPGLAVLRAASTLGAPPSVLFARTVSWIQGSCPDGHVGRPVVAAVTPTGCPNGKFEIAVIAIAVVRAVSAAVAPVPDATPTNPATVRANPKTTIVMRRCDLAPIEALTLSTTLVHPLPMFIRIR